LLSKQKKINEPNVTKKFTHQSVASYYHKQPRGETLKKCRLSYHDQQRIKESKILI